MSLETIAAASAASARLVPLDQSDRTRRYRRVLANSSYDAWVISWSPSAELDFHDHGGSAGIVHVVKGSLVETSTDLASDGRLRSTIATPGETLEVSASTVHSIWNPGPRDALSVHVYSPPLSSMTFYDDQFGALEPVRREEPSLAS